MATIKPESRIPVFQPGCSGNVLRCDKMALAGVADANWAHTDSETEAVAVGVSVVQTWSGKKKRENR